MNNPPMPTLTAFLLPWQLQHLWHRTAVNFITVIKRKTLMNKGTRKLTRVNTFSGFRFFTFHFKRHGFLDVEQRKEIAQFLILGSANEICLLIIPEHLSTYGSFIRSPLWFLVMILLLLFFCFPPLEKRSNLNLA